MTTEKRPITQRWPVCVTLAIGVLVFISPWAQGFSVGTPAAAWNYWILGAIAIIFSVIALAPGHAIAVEWVNLVAGAWLVVSPWVVGYSLLSKATSDAVLAGALLALFALWAIRGPDPRWFYPQ